jgi:prenyltransferase beta subunit
MGIMPRLSLGLLTALVCLAPVHGQTPIAKQAAVDYLQRLQAADGGFLPAQSKPGEEARAKSSLRATSGALRALKYLGARPRAVMAISDYIGNCYDRTSGGFADQPGGEPGAAVTAVGLMAAVEMQIPAERFHNKAARYLEENARSFEDIRIAAAGFEAIGMKPDRAKEWLEQVEAMRNPDGTYGKDRGIARATGGAVVVVLRLGGNVTQRENVVLALKKGQRADGGFGNEDVPGSDLESTYRILRAFVMLKEKPSDVPGLRAFIARCQNADGGFGVAPGQPSSVSGTYFAAILLHWLGDDRP